MYLGNGLPVLACVDSNTDIQCFINKNDLGIAVDCNNYSDIEAAISRLIDKERMSPINSASIAEKAQLYFGKATILAKFDNIFRRVQK